MPSLASALITSSRSQALSADQMANTPKHNPATLTSANSDQPQGGSGGPPVSQAVTRPHGTADRPARARPPAPALTAVRSGATLASVPSPPLRAAMVVD